MQHPIAALQPVQNVVSLVQPFSFRDTVEVHIGELADLALVRQARESRAQRSGSGIEGRPGREVDGYLLLCWWTSLRKEIIIQCWWKYHGTWGLFTSSRASRRGSSGVGLRWFDGVCDQPWLYYWCWLTGKANAFVEIDLVQEHLNFWIKKIYKADGDAHSWDWLALVSPCVDILRKLSTKINMELGAAQGSKHTVPDLQKDIERLMKSLREHSVYNVVPGRIVDPKDRPVPDVISVGLAQLTHGNATNPINEFNQQFERLRERRKLTPISDIPDLDDLPPSLMISSDGQAVAHTVVLENVLDSENASDLQNDRTCRPPSPTESENSVLEVLDPELEALLLESPTLQRIEAEDVDLDMDGWDLDSDGDMSEESEGEEEFE
ncbi:hypothetical protein BDZ97DRAFT_2042356 [Flammula alnicola]|nr:hypothetical protein BDZ97DRAFT_2042356 [Flammula alnicola]